MNTTPFCLFIGLILALPTRAQPGAAMATENYRMRVFEMDANTLQQETRDLKQVAKELEQVAKEIENQKRPAPSAAEDQKILAEEERLLAIPLSEEVEAPFLDVYSGLLALSMSEDERQTVMRKLRLTLGRRQDALNRAKALR